MAAHDNTPLSRLRPLSAEKWWGASGTAAGTAYFQGAYGVELNKAGRWIALHNETTRVPNVETDYATARDAMQACVDDRNECILRATAKKKAA